MCTVQFLYILLMLLLLVCHNNERKHLQTYKRRIKENKHYNNGNETKKKIAYASTIVEKCVNSRQITYG